MTDAEANPFWQFSLTLYARDGVAPACLRLQDSHELDVNIILYCCWAAECGVVLDAAAITGIVDGTSAWRRQVIQPLRAVRRALRGGLAPVAVHTGEILRDDVKRLELQAERLLQDALWRAFPLPVPAGGGDAGALARANLACYGRLAEADSAGEDFGVLADALSGVSPS
jgi:uncharacterized protein (TIGR02444 family)